MKNRKINNSGSTLVLVIVVIAFVSILTTTLLYLANMNYQMKSTDYKTRVSFYGSEIPMEEIRMQLTKDASHAAKLAYNDVLVNYGNYTSSDGGLRRAQYQDKFLTQLQTVWNDRTKVIDPTTGAESQDWIYGLKKVFNGDSDVNLDANLASRGYHVIADADPTDNVYCTTSGCTANCHVVLNPITGDRLEKDSVNGWVQLKGIKVVYTQNGFTSVIVTDFNVEVPDIDWSVNSYKDVADPASEGLNKTRKTVDFDTLVYYTNWVKQ